jgi:secondary thiamine-phosphate synthase enzyme
VRQALRTIWVATKGAGLYEFTEQTADFVRDAEIKDGLLTCYIRHTSASLIIQENADPDVEKDLGEFFAFIANSGPKFRHTTEGPDDMPSHIRSALTQTSVGIPIQSGRILLGTWQGIFVFEHRNAPHRREITLHLIGD